MSIAALLTFNAALLFMLLTATLAALHGKSWTEVMTAVASVMGSGLNRIKLVVAGGITAAIGLYDVITAGGIDLDHILRPIIGDHVYVGRLLATAGAWVTVPGVMVE